MLRRLCALFLMLACALAPALPAQAWAMEGADCCCGAACPCGPTDCAPPPCAPSAPAPTNIAALELRAQANKPAVRSARAAFAHFVSRNETPAALPAHPRAALAEAPAADVGLYQAHCSLLL